MMTDDDTYVLTLYYTLTDVTVILADCAMCHGSDGKVPDSAVMTTRAGSILVMDYS
jgi:cytochrome c553